MMIPRKRKTKRSSSKSKSQKVVNDDEFIAYVKKPSKKRKMNDPDVVQDSGETSISLESILEKYSMAIGDTETDATSSASIVAKPKINKSAVNLNNTGKPVSVKTLKMKNSKHKQKHITYDSGIELITSTKNVFPAVKKITADKELVADLQAGVLPPPKYDIKCTVIEAHLKKSAKSYFPECLKNFTYAENIDDPDKPKKSRKKSKNKHEICTIPGNQEEKNKESQEVNMEESKISNISQEENTNMNSDIPQALQEFYNEITQSFAQLTGEEPKSSKKKKKSALTVDKSVKDPNSLAEIVNKNSVLLDNSFSTNQLVQFFSLENKVILVLKPQTQLTFTGKLKLKVLYGAVRLYGSIFQAQNTIKPVEIYSPKGYSYITIGTYSLDGTYDKEALWDALTSEGVDRSMKTKLHDAIIECTDEWTVLQLENFENTLTNFLKTYCSFKLFPKIDNMKYTWCDYQRAEYVLQSNFQLYNPNNGLSISPQWNNKIIKQLLEKWDSTKKLRAVFVGGKNVGKSTASRYVINNLLPHSKKVVLLDLDPGQAEMTPSACLSLNLIDEPLLGPNFTHLKTPFYQMYLDDINVANCVTRYIECVKKLVDCYKSKKCLAQYPLIINTMGFCKNVGLDICIYLIKLIDPTDVIQISSNRPKNNYAFVLSKHAVNKQTKCKISLNEGDEVLQQNCDYELHGITTFAEEKQKLETWNMAPRQQRELVQLSYFSEIVKNADDKNFSNLALSSINNIVPYELPFSSFYVSLIQTSVSPSHILAAMNGNIVAMCGIDLQTETPEEDKKSLKYPMVIIKPPPCTCYGYGIVRGIDMAERKIYVNTPLDRSLLQHVNLLTGCSPPPFALLGTSSKTKHVQAAPYAGDRGELPTSRQARRGYFRGDQKKNTVS